MFNRFYKSLMAEHERWFLFQPVFFAIGIGIYFFLSFEPNLLFFVLCVLFSIITAFLSFKKVPLFLISTGILLITLGALDAKLQTMHTLSKLEHITNQHITYIKGRIKQTDINRHGKTRLLIENASDFEKSLKGLYRLTINDKAFYQTGECIETAAVLRPPMQPVTPNGYQFNRTLFFEGISAIGYTLTPTYQIPCENTHSEHTLLQTINHFRHQNVQKILKQLPQNEAAIASAVLLGNKTFISQFLYNQYRAAGLAHFLAISGLHMGFLTAFVFIIIRFILLLIPSFALRFSAHKTAAACATIFGFIYLLISGVSVSAERAFIMVAIVFSALIINKQAITMRTVALAAFIILIFEPHVLLSPGFQMSFAAVTALVAFFETYSPRTHFSHPSFTRKIILYFIGVLLTSLIATLATLPYAVYHFGTFAPYAVLSNIVAAPVIAFCIMPLVCLIILLLPFGLNTCLLKILGLCLTFLNHLAEYISNLAYADLIIPSMPAYVLATVTLGGLWLCLWQTKWRYFGIIFIILPFLSYAFIKKPDILYTDKTVALNNKKQNELIIYTKKSNKFLINSLSQNFPNIRIHKTLKSLPASDIICTQNECIFKNTFTFNLNGALSLNGQPLLLQNDLGGAIYLTNGKPVLKTIRRNIGFRPWNS